MKRVFCLLFLATTVFGQQSPRHELGFSPEKVYHFGDLDAVNTFNGNLMIRIPIGPTYPVSSTLQYSLVLTYNSNAWHFTTVQGYSLTEPSIRSNAGMGWLLSLGRAGETGYETPDGNQHKSFARLHESDQAGTPPSGVASVGYTRDNTYLRFKTLTNGISIIESPDGLTRVLDADGELSNINDRFDNHVFITRLATPPPACAGTQSFAFAWNISDGYRNNYVCFTDAPYPNSTWDGQIDRVVLTSGPPLIPGGAVQTATYFFNYTPMVLYRVPGSTWPPAGQTTQPTAMLTSITLPDSSTYAFTYNTNASSDTNPCDATTAFRDMGLLTSMTLPTKATITYTYHDFRMPTENNCDFDSFDTWVTGVAKRTVSGPSIPTATWTWCSTFNVTEGTVTCNDGNGSPFITGAPAEEMLVKHTDPDGNVTEQFYSVWPGTQTITSPDGFKIEEYSLPVTRMPQTAYGTTQLSTHTYTASEYLAGTPRRSSYVSYTIDDGCGGVIGQCPGNPRETAHRTLYHDDASKTLLTSYTDFDGLGHFRRTQTVDFDGTSVKETYTAFNQRDTTVNPTGYYFINSGTYPGSFTIPALDQEWILETRPYTRRSDATTTLLTQTCYEPQTGFLRAARARLNALTRKTADLLTTYTASAAGDVATETFAGGDVQNNASTTATLCQIADSPPSLYDYQLTHTYTAGIRATSQYTGILFSSLDQSVDAGSGLVLADTDPAGHTTTYAYDSKFRLTSVSPPGMAATTYAYANASVSQSGFTPASVQATITSAQGLGTITTHYQYDALGRLWRRKRQLADNTWSVQETTYDASGRVRGRSEEAALPATDEFSFHPPATTFSGFDPFGRPTTVTRPDATSTSYAYTGDRVRDKTTTIGSASVTDREEYDRYGHLRVFTQNYGSTPALAATYTYDVADHLTSVSIPSDAGTQTRTFTYDNRGFLLSEQHPELGSDGNGTTQYFWTDASNQPHASYDALGHAHRKVTGAFDLTLDFDGAERLTTVTETATSHQLVKTAYDGAFNGSCTGTSCYGKVSAAERDHYDPVLGTVVVTESYQYDSAGRPSRRDRTIGATGETFFFAQEYNDLGTIKKITYPKKTTSDRTPPDLTSGYTNGFLTSVTNTSDNSTSTISYQPNGLMNTVTHPGSTALNETWLADPSGIRRPCRIIAYNATITITDNASSPCGKQVTGTLGWDSGAYTYDADGNITQVGQTNEHHTEYTYDAFGRLAAWNVKDGLGGYSGTVRGYDAYGNWLYDAVTFCGAPVGNIGGRCGGSSVLAAQIAGTTNHYVGTTYDDAGNVVNDGARVFTYDATGALARTQVGGRDFHFLYTPDNERIAVVEPNVTISSGPTNRYTIFIRGFDDHLLSTYTTNPSTGASSWHEDAFFRGGDLLADNSASSGMRRYALDHLGSPRAIVDGNGTHVQDFAPFGYGGTSDGGVLQFTGHERDQASVGDGSAQLPDYFHARYYDSGRGRFLSVDPVVDVEKAVREPQMWNRYTYAKNNPVNNVDPNGKQAVPGQIYVSGQGWSNGSPIDPAYAPTPQMVMQYAAITASLLPMPGGNLVGRLFGRIGAFAVERLGFSAAERGVISATSKILQTGGADLVKAFESGEAKELTIAGQKIIVQPDAPISGMTLHGENAFVLGKGAFSSSTELSKTVLHEMYRLTFQQGGAASGASAAAATKAAADFAERAFDVLRIIY